ncbi:MAG: hypothetical protein R6V23_14435 [Bacteroidales bacterium]
MKSLHFKIVALLLFISILLTNISIFAQNVAVTDDESYVADSSAMLDVKSLTKGLLVPRMTTTQRSAIASPATGLLVFDTTLESFYFYDGTEWKNLSAEGIWLVNGDNLYLSDENKRVGIGVSNVNSKLEVKADASFGVDDTLFVVKDNAGYPVFAVFPDGAKVFVDQTAKGKVGGFAVSGRTSTKFTEEDYFHITPDSARIYINESAKGKIGGFAVSGRTSSKGPLQNYFNISGETSAEVIDPSEPRVLWYPNKEAFLVGRVLVEHSDSVGQNSLATGFESKAVGDWSQALGYNSIARGNYSTAIGKNAIADGVNSYAFGNLAYALNDDAIAIGSGSEATGQYSFAFGSTGIDSLENPTDNTVASGDYAYSFGLGALSSNTGSMSFGTNSVASGKFSMALGFDAEASGDYATSIGKRNMAIGYGSIAMGIYNKSTGGFSLAGGISSVSSGYASVAIGANNVAQGTKSIAMGEDSRAEGYVSVAIGKENQALSDHSVVFGLYNDALADESYIFGKYSGDGNKPGSFIFNTGPGKDGLYPSRSYQMNFKAQNGFRFFADIDTLENLSMNLNPVTGNLGIGIFEPNETAKLHVVGNDTLGQVIIAPNIASSGKNSGIFLAEDDDATFGMGLKYDGNSNYLFLYGKANSTIYGPHLAISRGSSTLVGIGTDSPDKTLTVQGDARVTGNIYYGSIGSGTTYIKPDFVFSDDYKQKLDIHEIDQYIKENKHLPWLTPAKDEVNGVNMTRMQFETLEAVENLQLQLIEVNKQNQSLKDQVNNQQEQINQLMLEIEKLKNKN